MRSSLHIFFVFLQCFVCGITYNNNIQFMKHLAGHAQDEGAFTTDNQCRYCLKNFISAYDLEDHLGSVSWLCMIFFGISLCFVSIEILYDVHSRYTFRIDTIQCVWSALNVSKIEAHWLLICKILTRSWSCLTTALFVNLDARSIPKLWIISTR